MQGKSIDKVFTDIDWGDVAGGAVSGAIAGGTMGIASAAGCTIVGTLAAGGVGGALGGQGGALTDAAIDQVASGEGWNTDSFLARAQASGLLNPRKIAEDTVGGILSVPAGMGLEKIEPLVSKIPSPVLKSIAAGAYKVFSELVGQLIDLGVHQLIPLEEMETP